MANIISEEERGKIKEQLINLGFDLLRKGSIKAVNIVVLTERCFIAKGTFYNLFPSKTDFLSKDIVKGKCEILNSHFASGKQFAQKGKGQNRKSLVLLTVSIRFLFT